MTTLHEKLQETTAFIQESGVGEVEFGLILGSGLGELADEIETQSCCYNDIPHFPVRQWSVMPDNWSMEH